MASRTHISTYLRDRLGVRCIRGPAHPPRTANIVLLCRIENGAEYVPDFLRHYRSLGVDHMMFLDTGSSDDTIDLLTGDDVTVYKTTLPFKTHRLWMRRWLMDYCLPGTWTLNVDIDELFDYPLSTHGSLPALVSYLDRNGYTAMRAHMLDMFSSGVIGAADASEESPLIERYPWYDLTNITPIDKQALFGTMTAYRGGIRATVFGHDHFWLSKHPFIRTGSGVDAFTDNEHSISQAHTADVTGVLLHFKFTPRFRTYVDRAVHLGQHWHDSAEYRLYQEVLARNPSLTLKQTGARRWNGVDALVDQEFLQASSAYRQAV